MPSKPLDRLMFAQGGLCFFCDQPLPREDASVEHLLASSKEGSNLDENCVACCKSINALFRNMSLKEKFDVVLNQKGNFKCPNGGSAAKLAPRPLLQNKPSPNPTRKLENFDMVVENLKNRGDSRPRTLNALTSTIASIFPNKKLAGAEVTALVEQLQSAGKVSVAKTKITYAF